VPITSVSMDVRPGGAWRATMFTGSARRESNWHGEYREVVAPERLVFTLTDRPGEDAEELVRVILNDLGEGRTEMLFEQRGGGLSREGYERAGQGCLRRDRRARGVAAAPGPSAHPARTIHLSTCLTKWLRRTSRWIGCSGRSPTRRGW
jgi:uncharacterized protein YndB with AHSA1/START domain